MGPVKQLVFLVVSKGVALQLESGHVLAVLMIEGSKHNAMFLWITEDLRYACLLASRVAKLDIIIVDFLAS